MSFFTTSTDKKSISESTREFISESGIYPVKIKFVSVQVNSHGARTLDFNVDYKGTETTLYGLRLDNNDGSENFQRKLFNKLCIITGFDTIQDPVDREHKVGKDQKLQKFKVLEQFDDLEVYINVRYAYSKWEGKIREQREIVNFYRYPDYAVANEIVNDTQAGVQYQKDLKYANNVRYSDGLTIEDVAKWKAERNNASNASATQSNVEVTEEDPF